MNNKKQLRKSLRDQYAQLPPSDIASIDADLVMQLEMHPAYKKANRLFLFVSVGNEVQTQALIDRAFSQNRTIALPKCITDTEMLFFEYDGRLEIGRYRIPEPINTAVIFPQKDDLMIVPGLAFDKKGYRIGQGRGYYDRYLSDCACTTIGVCREQFLLEEVPKEWNDLPVDYVITEATVYECKKRSLK